MKIINEIIAYENLIWAWNKCKHAYSIGDIWFNEIDLIDFEADLSNKLNEIRTEIKAGKYLLDKIYPVPFPKGYNEDKKEARTRQSFYISIRDQVTWLAVCNVIGKYLEKQMPGWSYGNRLYIPTWYDQNNKDLLVGNFRNTNGLIYRKWGQSWPLFRKHISATIKLMANPSGYENDKDKFLNEIDDVDRKTIEDNDKLKEKYIRLEYLDSGYFLHGKVDNLYWAGIDFAKFYPQIQISAVKEQIISDFKNQDDELFENLICALTKFEIDFTGWGKDIEDLNIKLNGSFTGLPTGLLVAGFLANVALLTIDKEVCDRLKENKHIAHFRFVDDHVILADDFGRLLEWIKSYNDIIKHSESGATINDKKLEPKELWHYIESEDVPPEDIKHKCTLDPMFPAPLMTQTLAKVSAISNTDLDLLTENETEKLITDLEHLLITDFPDQELKKETRISFSASVLSKLVPKRKIDYGSIYLCRKKIFESQKKVKKELEKKDKDTLEQLTILDSVLGSLICSENIVVDIEKQKDYLLELKKDKCGFIQQIAEYTLDTTDKMKSSLDLISIDERKISKRVFELLYKAVKENHHKVRLWIRILEYCYFVDIKRIETVFDLISTLKKNEVAHKQSADFIYTMFLSLIGKLIFKGIANLLNNKNISVQEYERTVEYINFVFNYDFLRKVFDVEKYSTKSYYQKSFLIFKGILGSALYILNSELNKNISDIKVISEFNLLQWDNNPMQWCDGCGYSINTWLFWLLDKTHKKDSVVPHDFWLELFKYIDFEEASAIPLLYAFPKLYSNEKINFYGNDKLQSFITSQIENEGWLFDLVKYNKKLLDEISFKILLEEKHPKVLNKIQNKLEGYITLYDWINLMNERIESLSLITNCFDPRTSEWTALTIIYKIIDNLMTSNISGNDYLLNVAHDKKRLEIHPANILIPEEWIIEKEYSWGDWRGVIDSDKKIEFCQENEMIADERYNPEKIISENFSNDMAIIYGLAVLLVQLVSKKVDLPWSWNEQNIVWSNSLISMIKDNSISSLSQLILSSCFSKRNRETMLLRKQNALNSQDKDINCDYENDPPIINSLKIMKMRIEQAIKVLENNQISVSGNMPRQIIPLSLVHYSNKHYLFSKETED